MQTLAQFAASSDVQVCFLTHDLYFCFIVILLMVVLPVSSLIVCVIHLYNVIVQSYESPRVFFRLSNSFNKSMFCFPDVVTTRNEHRLGAT